LTYHKINEKMCIYITKTESCWEVLVLDHEGNDAGSGTAPTFSGVYDIGYELATGDFGEYGDVHNKWVDFDANASIIEK
jgi:hypothetical protein